MAGPEKRLVNDTFKGGIAKAADGLVHWQRIEVWTDRGVPDVNFCTQGRDIWVECKYCAGKTDAAAQFTHPLTGPQVAFLKSRWAAGGNAYILARRGDTFRIFRGDDAHIVKREGFNGPWLEEFDKPWDWKSILETLTRFRERTSTPL